MKKLVLAGWVVMLLSCNNPETTAVPQDVDHTNMEDTAARAPSLIPDSLNRGKDTVRPDASK